MTEKEKEAANLRDQKIQEETARKEAEQRNESLHAQLVADQKAHEAQIAAVSKKNQEGTTSCLPFC